MILLEDEFDELEPFPFSDFDEFPAHERSAIISRTNKTEQAQFLGSRLWKNIEIGDKRVCHAL